MSFRPSSASSPPRGRHYIPSSARRRATRPRPRCAHAPSRAATTRPIPHRILLVENEPAIASAIERFASQHDIQIDFAANAEAAAIANFSLYDAVILDFRLGAGGTGGTVYRAITARAPRLSRCTIFITGDLTSAVESELAATGQPVLYKPFSLARLGELLLSMLRPPGVTTRVE